MLEYYSDHYIMKDGERFPIIDKETLKFNERLNELLCREVSYDIELSSFGSIQGVGCLIYGIGGDTSNICIIGTIDPERKGRSVDIRFPYGSFLFDEIRHFIITVIR